MVTARSEAIRFRVLQIYPLLCRQCAMYFSQTAEIYEEDPGIFQAQGQQDITP